MLVNVEHGCEHGVQSDQADTTQSNGQGRRQGSSSSGWISVQKLLGTGS